MWQCKVPILQGCLILGYYSAIVHFWYPTESKAVKYCWIWLIMVTDALWWWAWQELVRRASNWNMIVILYRAHQQPRLTLIGRTQIDSLINLLDNWLNSSISETVSEFESILTLLVIKPNMSFLDSRTFIADAECV